LNPAAPDRLRLFCFPHAGAGTLAYRHWTGALPGVDVVPVLLPGRETRSSEPPFENMRDLIAALTTAIQPLLEAPYAFFGHSMGSGIAFELARSLRRIGAQQPRMLIVSSARAPRCRVDQSHQPEPTDAELMNHLRRLGGVPEALFDNPAAIRLLAADSRMYRNYLYQPEPPLAIPIAVYGGATDPSLTPEHLDAWREQTTATFVRREFEGGHFYLQSNPNVVFEALRLDLNVAPGQVGARIEF
jgi:medium-chain acyl-[acyl-carrier-protein] hydrolase